MSYALLHTGEEEIVKVVEKLISGIQTQLPQYRGQRLQLKDYKQSDEVLRRLNSENFQFVLVLLDEKLISDLAHRRSFPLYSRLSEFVLSGSREKSCILFIKYQISESDEDFKVFKADLKGEPHMIEFTSYEEVTRYSSKCMVEREATESSELDTAYKTHQLSMQQCIQSDPQLYLRQPSAQLDLRSLQHAQYPQVRPMLNQFGSHSTQQAWQQLVHPPLHQLDRQQIQQSWNQLNVHSLQQDDTGTTTVPSCRIPQPVRDIMDVEGLSLQEPVENSLHSSSSLSDVQLQSSGSGSGAYRNELQRARPSDDRMTPQSGTQFPQVTPQSGTQFSPVTPQSGTQFSPMTPQSGTQFPPNVQIVDPSILPVRFQYPANTAHVIQPNQQGDFHYPANNTNITNMSMQQRRNLLSFDSNQFNSVEGNSKENTTTGHCPSVQRPDHYANNLSSAEVDSGLTKSSDNSKKNCTSNNINQKSPIMPQLHTLETDIEEKLSKENNSTNPDSNLTGRSFASSYILHGGIGDPGFCVNCMQMQDCLPIRAPQPSFNSVDSRFNVNIPANFSMSSLSGPHALPCLSGFGYCSSCLWLFEQENLKSQQLGTYSGPSDINSKSTDLNEILTTGIREEMVNSLKKDENQSLPASSQPQAQQNLLPHFPRPRSVPLINPHVQQQRLYSSLNQPYQGMAMSQAQSSGQNNSVTQGLSTGNNRLVNDMNRSQMELMYTREMMYNISGTGSFHNSGESETDNTKAPVSTKQTQTDRQERLSLSSEWGTSGGASFIPQSAGSDGASSIDSGVAGATGGVNDVDDRSVWDLSKSVLSYVRDTLDLSSVYNWQDIAEVHGWSYGKIHQLKTRWDRRQVESPFLELIDHFQPYTVGNLKEDLRKISRKDVLSKLQKYENNNELFS